MASKIRLMPTIYLTDDENGPRLVRKGFPPKWWLCYGGRNNGGYDSFDDALKDHDLELTDAEKDDLNRRFRHMVWS